MSGLESFIAAFAYTSNVSFYGKTKEIKLNSQQNNLIETSLTSYDMNCVIDLSRDQCNISMG